MKTRFTRTSLYLALGALATSLVSVQAYGQAKTTYKEKDLGILPAQQDQPDLTGLWYHINERQIQQANEEFCQRQGLSVILSLIGPIISRVEISFLHAFNVKWNVKIEKA